jgi:methylase of polypeptide subunit release factors
LVAGPLGIEPLQRIVALASRRLVTGGWLLVEIGPPAASEEVLARAEHLIPEPTLFDTAGRPRVVQARRR